MVQEGRNGSLVQPGAHAGNWCVLLAGRKCAFKCLHPQGIPHLCVLGFLTPGRAEGGGGTIPAWLGEKRGGQGRSLLFQKRDLVP